MLCGILSLLIKGISARLAAKRMRLKSDSLSYTAKRSFLHTFKVTTLQHMFMGLLVAVLLRNNLKNWMSFFRFEFKQLSGLKKAL
jgi:hypothetical protein